MFNRRGELLIEGVASFVILIIILVAATGMVFAAIHMNQKADEINAKTEANVDAVESALESSDTGGTSATFSINMGDATLTQDISVNEKGDLVYFKAR